MMDTGKVFEVIAGKKQFDRGDLIPTDWINLILGRCEELKPYLPDFCMMRTISLLMTSHFLQTNDRSWGMTRYNRNHQTLNPPKSFTLLNFEELKKTQNITPQTRIVPVFYIMNPEANGFGGTIILTENGTLHWWKWCGKNLGRGWGEDVTHATLEPLTVIEMRSEFAMSPAMPYTIFYNLSHLPEVHARYCREQLIKVEALSGFCIGSCNLIEEIR